MRIAVAAVLLALVAGGRAVAAPAIDTPCKGGALKG
ncbi:MAG: hypothetical protein QOH73_1689, partial [Gaiellaceae bacterium]|nr:hypothetical protein [Gaiellaceae bacterium]